MNKERNKIALIIGGGPAGLTCAYSILLNTDDIKPIVIEKDDILGGISKTIDYDGFKTDIGPHRFFTKDDRVFEFWESILKEQGELSKDDIQLNRSLEYKTCGANPETEDNVLLKRRRFSRIFYMNKFFDYPVKMNLKTVLNLGILKTLICGFSYIKSCVFKRKEVTLEDFMINRFGVALYKTFFEHYTQKVWGRHPSIIDKEWGAQRIKGLSLIKAILSKFNLFKAKETSLIESYYYPKYGSGHMWGEISKKIIELGGEIHLKSEVIELKKDNNKIHTLKVKRGDETFDYYGDYIISSMPIKDLLLNLNDVPSKVIEIAKNLPYRDYILVSFLLKDFNLKNNTDWKTTGDICPDSWIYVQDRCVKVGRIYIPRNFSPYISKNDENILIGMEYFVNEGDEIWSLNDDDLFEFAKDELLKIKAIKSKDDVLKGYRENIQKAYPAYFDSYKDFDEIKKYLLDIKNLYCIGRNGQHKYNNMDHSTLSGLVAVDVIKGEIEKEKLFEVNTEKDYQETK